MKIKIRSDDASVLQERGWSQMGDWLAELRDDGRTEPPGDGHAEADRAGDPWPEALVQADALADNQRQRHHCVFNAMLIKQPLQPAAHKVENQEIIRRHHRRINHQLN